MYSMGSQKSRSWLSDWKTALQPDKFWFLTFYMLDLWDQIERNNSKYKERQKDSLENVAMVSPSPKDTWRLMPPFSPRAHSPAWRGRVQSPSWEHEAPRVETRELGKPQGQSHRESLSSLCPGPTQARSPPHVCLHPELVWAALRILRECGGRRREALVLGCPLASTCRLCRGRGGLSHAVAMAPNVQGTLVSRGASVSAITRLGWWFCLHDPKQRVWVRSSHKDWWGRAIRGQKTLTSFKQRMWYSLRWLKPHCELIAKHF